MTAFSRTVTVTAELSADETVRLRGLLEDHIYAMELALQIRIGDGVITSIEGSMKRFTTPWCRDAVPALQRAVGLSVREKGWISRVNRDIGRQGCEHFAAILVECGRCLDTARLSRAVCARLAENPASSAGDEAAAWIGEHPEAWRLRESPAS